MDEVNTDRGGEEVVSGAWTEGVPPVAEEPDGESAGARLLRRGDALGDEIAELAAHLDAATHRILVALREFEDTGAWAEQGFQSCANWLSWRVGWAPGG